MGRQQIVSFTWTCDLCGNEIPESDAEGASRKISWEGTDYLVDLCATHQGQLSEALEGLKVYVDAGQRSAPGRRRRKAGVGPSSAPSSPTRRSARVVAAKSTGGSARDLGAIRTWARENGHQVSERGRISGSILSAYDDANNAEAPAGVPAPKKRRPRKAAAAEVAS